MGALDGKVALITGGASGIGKATVERFAAEGARVCVVDFDENGKAVADAVQGLFVPGDMGESTEVDAAFDTCERELGGIDIAFLNAGIAIGIPDIAGLTDDDYRRIMRVNVDGVVYGLRAAIRALRRRGGGSIVATASLAGLLPFPLDPIYDLTKHGVVGLIRSVAPNLVADNISANTVNPGMTDTNILAEEAKDVFKTVGFPLMPASQIADAVFGLVTTGVTGQCWVCQPGRDPIPYEFHGVPGPRGDGEGLIPPEMWDNRSPNPLAH